MKYSISLIALCLTFNLSHAENSEAYEKVPDQIIPLIYENQQITNTQQHILLKAYDIAKEDGHKDPELLPAVIFQETHAGSDNKQQFTVSTKICYGIAQIKLQAAKAVLKSFEDLRARYASTKTDVAIVKKLSSDDEFNTRIASKYLIMMETKSNNSSAFKAAAYNRGEAGVKHVNPNKMKYVKSILQFMKKFKSHYKNEV